MVGLLLWVSASYCVSVSEVCTDSIFRVPTVVQVDAEVVLKKVIMSVVWECWRKSGQ